MKKQAIGVIGLAVMGKNLAYNIESKGYSVSVYNRTRSRTDNLLKESAEKNITGEFTLKDFVESLETPKKIIIMVKAGEPVDEVLKELEKYISKGDILVDAGNTYYKDTIRRSRYFEGKGIHYIGMGVSGGEEGALKGPSLMPGGDYEAYKVLEPILKSIAANVNGDPCCTYIGKDGAGHYVKMVHNGIEYGDMQLICEAYSILRYGLDLTIDELHNVFSDWNNGELDSYLIEITADILTKYDPETGKPMVDIILDRAGQKGTGKWAVQDSLDLGAAIPTISEAVYARNLSDIKEERIRAEKILKGPSTTLSVKNKAVFIESVRRALYASKICSYAQGFALYKKASDENNWNLNYGDIAMIFRGGCIIRAQFLNRIKQAYDRNPDIDNILLDPYFSGIIEEYQDDWRKVVIGGIESGIPLPAFTSSLSYFDSYRRGQSSANLLQAQRDYFGAHTFKRVDKEGSFHFEWL